MKTKKRLQQKVKERLKMGNKKLDKQIRNKEFRNLQQVQLKKMIKPDKLVLK
jgi:hypothetical protein